MPGSRSFDAHFAEWGKVWGVVQLVGVVVDLLRAYIWFVGPPKMNLFQLGEL